MATLAPERQTELVFDLNVSPKMLGGLAIDAAQNFPGEHPRLTGAMLGLALGWAKGAAVVHAQDGTASSGDPVSAVKEHVGPYVALGIAAGSGLLAGIGNGMRVFAQERATIDRMGHNVDEQTSGINEYSKMGPQEFIQEYAMKAMQQGKQPDQADAAEYAAQQIQSRPQEIEKMLRELQQTKIAILKRKASLPIVVAGEAGQALLGVTGTVAMVYYTIRGMMEDLGKYGDDVLLKTLLVDGGVGALLPVFAMVRDIVEVESASGGRGARTQGALRHLQAVGMAPKEQKKARPKLEVGGSVPKSEKATAGGNGSKPKFKVRMKQ